MPRKGPRESLCVNKSLSIPISVVNSIIDESEIMGKDFSGTSVVLLRMGLSMRRAQDEAERDRINQEREQAKKDAEKYFSEVKK
jgi:hypothetical protein